MPHNPICNTIPPGNTKPKQDLKSNPTLCVNTVCPPQSNLRFLMTCVSCRNRNDKREEKKKGDERNQISLSHPLLLRHLHPHPHPHLHLHPRQYQYHPLLRPPPALPHTRPALRRCPTSRPSPRRRRRLAGALAAPTSSSMRAAGAPPRRLLRASSSPRCSRAWRR